MLTHVISTLLGRQIQGTRDTDAHHSGPAPARRLVVAGYFETVLVSAVVTILGVRGALAISGYPQVGGGGLHIAHMLWGGLLLLVANIIMLGFIGERSRWLGALAAGVGFGLFIDELGKFITSNNDYFFQPTIGLLYIAFVLLFELFRLLGRVRTPSRSERLANLGDALADALVGSHAHIGRARSLVNHLDAADSGLAGAVRQVLDRVEPDAPSAVEPLASRAHAASDAVLGWRWFQRAVAAVFIVNALVGVLLVLGVLALGGAIFAGGFAETTLARVAAEPDFAGWAQIVVVAAASFAALIMTLIGLARLRTSRLDGFVWLHRGVVVSLLLIQPFAFFSDQFGALWSLALNLVLWAGTGYVIRTEQLRTTPR
jgi:hypothetical protein